MSKIPLDKYYTSQELADYCTQKAIEVIGKENITELVESSAGNGVFLNSFERLLSDVPYLAYDIEPEDSRIIKQDYLSLNLEYKKGRCVIGNPPFGKGNTLSVQFFKKCIHIGDYIAFILPISQLNNNQQMYEFNLIYSEDLGRRNYTHREVHCCFNIYKRPSTGFNNKSKYKLNDITIVEIRQGNKDIKDYDYRICNFGAATGKEVEYPCKYVHELAIIINNIKLKELILHILKTVKWKEIYHMTSIPALYKWQVYKYLKEQIPELE